MKSINARVAGTLLARTPPHPMGAATIIARVTVTGNLPILRELSNPFAQF
jgi:hypothetical protein